MAGDNTEDHRTDPAAASDAPDRFHEPEAPDASQGALPSNPAAINPTPVSASVDTGYTASGVPTFDAVREKIETRFGASIGAAELDSETPEGRRVEEQYEARQQAAAERLDQIRKSMRPDSSETQT